ncbi:MAG: 3-phosphoshikimate 1-carboxyvinyltransferase, partial [Caldilineae bacterium]
DGHSGLRRRPMERIARPLRRMGASVETDDGRPPLRLRGGMLTGVDWTLPIPSAQVKSAILLAGLFATGETVVRQPGPARDHTERMLRAQGVNLSVEGNVIRLQPPSAPLRPLRFTVPGDFSSAAFLVAAALLVPNSRLRLEGVNVNPTRTGLLDVLRAMGASVSLLDRREQAGEPLADLQIESASSLRGTEIGGDTVVRMIDEFPILAVVATQARGVTVVRDAAELRVKETDRIKSTVLELRKMGAHLIPHPDGFEVHGPTPLRGAEVDSCGDHRLAMALAVAGLVADSPTTIHNAAVIADSFPGFVDALRQVGAKIEE